MEYMSQAGLFCSLSVLKKDANGEGIQQEGILHRGEAGTGEKQVPNRALGKTRNGRSCCELVRE